MHKMINELTAYIFTAGLAFNMAKYQPVYPPPLIFACLVACAGPGAYVKCLMYKKT